MVMEKKKEWKLTRDDALFISPEWYDSRAIMVYFVNNSNVKDF